MLFKKVAAIAIISFGVISCDQASTKEGENSETTETAPQEQMQEQSAPDNQGQTQQRQMPSDMQQGQTKAADITDDRLQKFANISQEIQVMNQSSQQEMMTAIESEGLKVDRFTVIQQSQQDNGQEVEVTPEEMKKFEAANQALKQVQMETQEKMIQKLEEEGVSQSWYQETAMAIQSDQELMQRFQALQQPAAQGEAVQ
jgi:hypothetical protein